MYPLLVFPALSSALIPTSREGFSRFLPIEIDACLFASSLSSRARSSPTLLWSFTSSPSSSLSLSPVFPSACFSYRIYVADFRCQCRFPSARASVHRTCVHLRINLSSLFSPTLSRLSSPRAPYPATLSSQLVSARCRRRLARHISPGLCINFSSLLLSFPSDDQYFVTYRLHNLLPAPSANRGLLEPNKIRRNFAYYVSA